MRYPPFVRLVYIGVIGRDRSATLETAKRYGELLRENGVDVLGPAPYPIARVNDEWRFRLALKTTTPKALRATIRERVLPLARKERATRIAVNVDP